MHHDTTVLARYVPDLAQDRFHVWITKYTTSIAALGLLLVTVGGIEIASLCGCCVHTRGICDLRLSYPFPTARLHENSKPAKWRYFRPEYLLHTEGSITLAPTCNMVSFDQLFVANCPIIYL